MAEHLEEGVLTEGPEDPAIAQEGDHTIRGRLVLTAASSEESVEQGEEVPLLDVNPLSLQWREDIQALRLGGLGALLMSHLELALLAAGLVLSAVSCCGCVGALRENACLLRAYSLALLCLIMAATALGTLVLVMPAGAKRVVQRTLSATLVVHYRDSPDAQQLVDAVQRHLSCCGMTSKSFRDWNDNMYVASILPYTAFCRASSSSACVKLLQLQRGEPEPRTLLGAALVLQEQREPPGEAVDGGRLPLRPGRAQHERLRGLVPHQLEQLRRRGAARAAHARARRVRRLPGALPRARLPRRAGAHHARRDRAHTRLLRAPRAVTTRSAGTLFSEGAASTQYPRASCFAGTHGHSISLCSERLIK
ncbi:uncharacterized protein [Dermacentor albipictus]|uniref:uncharacterized protein isoform X2 n=1 Tax=Dermacentor albipictus TaxID=60249 RepID=UPI0031FC2517